MLLSLKFLYLHLSVQNFTFGNLNEISRPQVRQLRFVLPDRSEKPFLIQTRLRRNYSHITLPPPFSQMKSLKNIQKGLLFQRIKIKLSCGKLVHLPQKWKSKAQARRLALRKVQSVKVYYSCLWRGYLKNLQKLS